MSAALRLTCAVILSSCAAACNGSDGLSCPVTAAAYCADGGACYSPSPASPACGSNIYVGACPGYSFVTNYISAEQGFQYFYDASTGNLVAVLSLGLDGTTCVAGPQHFQVPGGCAAPKPAGCDAGQAGDH